MEMLPIIWQSSSSSRPRLRLTPGKASKASLEELIIIIVVDDLVIAEAPVGVMHKIDNNDLRT